MTTEELEKIRKRCEPRSYGSFESMLEGFRLAAVLCDEIERLQDFAKHHGFEQGVKSMARNCKWAIELIRSKGWNLNQIDAWLDAVITDDPNYLKSIVDQFNFLPPEPAERPPTNRSEERRPRTPEVG